LSSLPPSPRVLSPATAPGSEDRGLSPVEALSSALDDTLQLLFQPFDGRRWFKLTVVCLFLGGGTPSAAFQWILSSHPQEIRLSEVLAPARQYLSQHVSLMILAMVLGAGLAITWLYLRCVFRFVLVDSIIRQEVFPGDAWRALQPLGQSYFFWLLAILAVAGIALSAAGVVAFPFLQTTTGGETRPLFPSLFLIAGLAAVVLVGLVVALFITLTDDLVVPLMYAERVSFPAVWRKLGKRMRAEPGLFGLYLLLRFTVTVAIGVGVLFFLFPVLVGAFSFAIIVAALVVLGLRVVGLGWAWNPFTVFLALAALLLFCSVLLILLSIVGMPGQVFLQDFGMRFIASRFPSLQGLWRLSDASGRAR
jgi:MFS family permease